MKKLTFLVCFMAVSLTLFAQGKITYVLNGGITNDYGWTSPDSMFASFMTDAGATDFETLAYYKQQADPLSAPNICAKLTDAVSALSTEKWAWLKAYIESVHAAQADAGASVLSDDVAAAWRFAVGAFFIDWQRTGWPKSANFASCGVSTYEAYKDFWKQGFAGPTEYAAGETIVLTCVPYPAKSEKESFLGWYKDAKLTEKVTVISGTGDVTLYAKFGEYMPHCAEVAALPDGSETKVGGTVTCVIGSEFWIQDAEGALMCNQQSHGLVVGEEVVLQGTKVTYGGIPELKNISVVSHHAGNEVLPQVVLIADVLADSVGKFTSKLVKFEGVRVKYETSGKVKKPILYDVEHEIPCNRVTLNSKDFRTGVKVSATLVVSEYNGIKQMRGLAKDFGVSASVDKDTYEYLDVIDTVSDTQYQLTNNWLYSQILDNWQANRPNPLPEGSHAMIHKDGILYFPYRSANEPTDHAYIVRVNAKTGEMLEPVYFADSVMKKNGTYLYGPFTDMKMDNAGNVITSNMSTCGGDFQIWSVDPATGGGKLLIDHTTEETYLRTLFPGKPCIRLDRIGVYGDITKDATIASVVSNGAEVYVWSIKDGKWNGEVSCVKLSMEGTVGGAPQIYPIANGYFYVDGFFTYPILFDADGNIVDEFTSGDAKKLLINSVGTGNRSVGHNGVREFEIPKGEGKSERYLIVAGDDIEGPAPSTFVLYKFKDENCELAEMTQLFEFPYDGMGSAANPQRVAISDVVVDAETGVATIYVYTTENGYGSYSFQGKPAIPANSVTLQSTSQVMKKGEMSQFNVTVLPAEAYQGVDWTTSDATVATVQDGLVQAVGEGTAVITVKAVVGNASANCTITVK